MNNDLIFPEYVLDFCPIMNRNNNVFKVYDWLGIPVWINDTGFSIETLSTALSVIFPAPLAYLRLISGW